MTKQDYIALLEQHSQAWNDHDVEGILALMSEDCVYDAAAGAVATGQHYAGKPALRAAFTAIFAAYAEAEWANAQHSLDGDFGVSTWTFRGTTTAGQKVEVNGLDILRIVDGQIVHKDTYRKTITA